MLPTLALKDTDLFCKSKFEPSCIHLSAPLTMLIFFTLVVLCITKFSYDKECSLLLHSRTNYFKWAKLWSLMQFSYQLQWTFVILSVRNSENGWDPLFPFLLYISWTYLTKNLSTSIRDRSVFVAFWTHFRIEFLQIISPQKLQFYCGFVAQLTLALGYRGTI